MSSTPTPPTPEPAPACPPGQPAAGGPARAPRKRQRRRAKPGASPGTLVVDPSAPRPVMNVIAYGPGALAERAITTPEAVREWLGVQPVTWLDLSGLGDVETLRKVGALFGLHLLELEDVVNVHQRPKVDSYAEHVFVVVRMIEPGAVLETEQLSLFLGKNFVLTFQERPGDGFGPVRERLRNAQGAVRAAGPDYLAYALIDAAIDGYFPTLESLGERIERLEEAITLHPCTDHLQELHQIKRDLLTLRRAVWPLREAVNQLQRESSGLVRPETRPYLNDLYDHTVQIMDLVETYREIGSGLLEIYLSSMSHRLNEVMKVLTVIATIFIPLTFISSIWGMNFVHMPELHWTYGYPLALLLMLVVGLALLLQFYRRGWLGSGAARRAQARRERQP